MERTGRKRSATLRAVRLGPPFTTTLGRMIRPALLAIGCVLVTSAAAEAECVSPSSESKAFAAATDIVRHLPEVKAWSGSHSFPVAYHSNAKPLVRNGRCYIPVVVSASRPERLEHWHLFYVHTQSRSVLIQEPSTGDVMSLKEWRSKS